MYRVFECQVKRNRDSLQCEGVNNVRLDLLFNFSIKFTAVREIKLNSSDINAERGRARQEKGSLNFHFVREKVGGSEGLFLRHPVQKAGYVCFDTIGACLSDVGCLRGRVRVFPFSPFPDLATDRP